MVLDLNSKLRVILALDVGYRKNIKRYERAANSVKREIEEYFDDINSESIHYIKSRVKTRESIIGKAERRGCHNPLEEIDDIAGIRVVCHNESDVEQVAAFIKARYSNSIIKDEMLKREDGYSAHHIVVNIKPLIAGEPENTKVEIQIRTIAQDLFGTLSHRDLYKLSASLPQSWIEKMKQLSKKLEEVDKLAEELKQEWIKENLRTKTKDTLTAETIIRICKEKLNENLNVAEALYYLSNFIKNDINKISELEAILEDDELNNEIEKIYLETFNEKPTGKSKLLYGAMLYKFKNAPQEIKEKVYDILKDSLRSALEYVKRFKKI